MTTRGKPNAEINRVLWRLEGENFRGNLRQVLRKKGSKEITTQFARGFNRYNFVAFLVLIVAFGVSSPGIWAKGRAAYYNKKATYYYERKDLKKAEEYYMKALKLEPESPEHLYNVAIVSFSQGNYQEAATLFKKTLEYNPAYLEAHYNLGLCYSKMEKLDSEIEQYKKVLSLDSKIPDAHYALALAYAKKNNKERSIFHLKKAIEYYPPGSESQKRCRKILEEIERHNASNSFQNW